MTSLPIGTGHDIAAKALTEAFLAQDVEVVSSQHLASPIKWQIRSYLWAIRYTPRLYSALYYYSEDTTRWWRYHRAKWLSLGQDLLVRVYDELRPDWIVATHPFALTAWAGVKQRRPDMRLAGILTDLSVHQFWWEPEADAYTVWLPEQQHDLEQFGCQPHRIWATGIPIRAFFRRPSIDPIKRFREAPIVILGGGLGLGPYVRILRRATLSEVPVVVVCGHNEALRWRLAQMNWPGNVTIVGFVEQMPHLLRASRLVLGKPGGVTAAEICQSQVPWILTHWIAGQEEANRDRLVAHGLAVTGRRHLHPLIQEMMGDDGGLRGPMQDQQKYWARPQAAQDIVAKILASGG